MFGKPQLLASSFFSGPSLQSTFHCQTPPPPNMEDFPGFHGDGSTSKSGILGLRYSLIPISLASLNCANLCRNYSASPDPFGGLHCAKLCGKRVILIASEQKPF